MIIAILVSYGESSTSAIHGCNNPNIFVSYLDFNRYNNTNNFMDFNNVVVPMVDHITEGKPFSENIHDLVTIWIEVCKADDPEKENAAWKELAKEIHHRLHSDESVAQIARVIFGDRLVPWIMDPPHSLVTNSRVEDCIFRLVFFFILFSFSFLFCFGFNLFPLIGILTRILYKLIYVLPKFWVS